MRRFLAVVIAATLAGGCAAFRDKDEGLRPAELTELKPQISVRELWHVKVGGEASQLRLGLRVAGSGDTVYVANRSGDIVAYDAETGRESWRNETELPLSAGPAVAEDMILAASSDGDVVAVDVTSGRERWRTSVDSEVLSAPVASEGVVVVRAVDGSVHGLSSIDGRILWSVNQRPPLLSVRGTSRPVVSDEVVYVGFDNGKVMALGLRDGHELWTTSVAAARGRTEIDRLVDIDGRMEVFDDGVFVAGYQSSAVRLSRATGQVVWRQDLSSYRGLKAEDEHVFVTSDIDEVVALDSLTGGIQWRQDKLLARGLTAPAVMEATLVVGDYEGYLHWLNPYDGTLLARAHIDGGAVYTDLLVANRHLYAQTAGGELVAFAIVHDQDTQSGS